MTTNTAANMSVSIGAFVGKERILPEFTCFQQWTVADVRVLMKKFEAKQHGYGFKVSKSLFLSLFSDLPVPQPPAEPVIIPPQVSHSRPTSAAVGRHHSVPSQHNMTVPPSNASTMHVVHQHTTSTMYDDWAMYPMTIVQQWWQRWATAPSVTLRAPSRDQLLGGATAAARNSTMSHHRRLLQTMDDADEAATAMIRATAAQQRLVSQSGTTEHRRSSPFGHDIDAQWPDTANAMLSSAISPIAPARPLSSSMRSTPRSAHHDHATPRRAFAAHTHGHAHGRDAEFKSSADYYDDYGDDDNDGHEKKRPSGEESVEMAMRCDMLEMCAGLLIICRASFAQKLHALFSLFNFSKKGILSKLELVTVVSGILVGWCKLRGVIPPTLDRCDSIYRISFKDVQTLVKNDRFSFAHFYQWAANSKWVVSILCRYGTNDADIIRRRLSKHHDEQQGERNPRTGTNSLKPVKLNRWKFYLKNNTSLREVKNLKALFDTIDYEGVGYISLEYLLKPKKYTDPFLLRYVTSVFQTLKPNAKSKTSRGNVIDEPTPSVERALLPTPLQDRNTLTGSTTAATPSAAATTAAVSPRGNQLLSLNFEMSPSLSPSPSQSPPAQPMSSSSASMLNAVDMLSAMAPSSASSSLLSSMPLPISIRSLSSPSSTPRATTSAGHRTYRSPIPPSIPSSTNTTNVSPRPHTSSARRRSDMKNPSVTIISPPSSSSAPSNMAVSNVQAASSTSSSSSSSSSVLLPPLPLQSVNNLSPVSPRTQRSSMAPSSPASSATGRSTRDIVTPRSRSASNVSQSNGNTTANTATPTDNSNGNNDSLLTSTDMPPMINPHMLAAPSVAEAQQMMWATGRVTFAQLLAVMYQDNSSEERKLMLGLVFNPVTRDTVTGIQRVFDRLDTQFQGKVKLPRIIDTLGKMEAYHKLIETYKRGHVLGAPDVYVGMRELLNLLFAKSHGRDMKKIINWAKPSKLLDEKQQEELARLFSSYDTNRDDSIGVDELKIHLQKRGMPVAEVMKMFADVDIDNDNSISLQEFQIFYRDIWDTYVNFDISCLSYDIAPETDGDEYVYNPPLVTNITNHTINTGGIGGSSNAIDPTIHNAHNGGYTSYAVSPSPSPPSSSSRSRPSTMKFVAMPVAGIPDAPPPAETLSSSFSYTPVPSSSPSLYRTIPSSSPSLSPSPPPTGHGMSSIDGIGDVSQRSTSSATSNGQVILPMILRDVDDELLWPRRSRTRSSCLPRDGATYDDRLLYPLCAAPDCESNEPLPSQSLSATPASALAAATSSSSSMMASSWSLYHDIDIAAAAATVKQCRACTHATVFLCARHQALHHQVTGHT